MALFDLEPHPPGRRRGPVQLLLSLLLALCLLPASAQGIRDHISNRGITDAEFAILPEWCYDSQGGPYGAPEGAEMMNRSPRAPRWVAAMGPDFWHLHHYCWALRDMRRAALPDTSVREKGFLWARAVSDLVYTIRHCLPTMPLMPEVHLRLGEVYLLQGNIDGAQREFERSRQLKPDYWPAYAFWADFLIEYKLWDRARTLVAEGLKYAPDNAELRKRMDAIERQGRGGSAALSGHNNN